MANKNYSKTRIKVPSNLSASERRALAEDFIDHLTKRTSKGQGVDEKPWKGSKANQYTKAYRETLEFKSKTRKGKVNLEVFGDMLDSIKLISNRPGEIAIGVKKGDAGYGKAEGNIRGTYGSKTPNRKKARNFMELSKRESNKIIKPYKDSVEAKDRATALKLALLVAEEASEAITDEA